MCFSYRFGLVWTVSQSSEKRGPFHSKWLVLSFWRSKFDTRWCHLEPFLHSWEEPKPTMHGTLEFVGDTAPKPVCTQVKWEATVTRSQKRFKVLPLLWSYEKKFSSRSSMNFSFFFWIHLLELFHILVGFLKDYTPNCHFEAILQVKKDLDTRIMSLEIFQLHYCNLLFAILPSMI